jgi:PAS domain S-box-containing protein
VTDPPLPIDSAVIAAALGRLRTATAAPGDNLLEALAELDVAYEELRVAEDELRTQHEAIDALLAADQQRRSGQLTDTMPVASMQTDADGIILDGNPAAAGLLGLPAGRLIRRVLFSSVELPDRRLLRRALSEVASGRRSEVQVDVAVRDAGGQVRPVRLFGWRDSDPPGPALIRWLAIELPDGAEGRVSTFSAREAASVPLPAPEPAAMAMAQAFADLVLLPSDSVDEQRLLRRIVAVVRGAVPGATSISMTVGPPLEPQLLASDEAVAQVFDGRQMTAGEGPCPDAYLQRAVVVSEDVTGDDRWPRLRRALTDGRVRSVLAVPVQLPDQRWGVLGIYSDRAGVFTADSVRLGQILAAVVAGILRDAADRARLQQLAANLEAALTSRAVIDQAKGLLIGRYGIAAEDAFVRLARLSQALNLKVRDLAPLVVATNPEVLAALDRL